MSENINPSHQPRCVWCGGTSFSQRNLMLNTRGLSFLDMEWANRNADCRICDSCGYIHWFLPQR